MTPAEPGADGAGRANEFHWTSASCSHPGRVREVNEDACLEQPHCKVWAVADGMGGHALGEFASRLAIRSLMDLVDPTKAAASLQAIVATADERLQQTNRRLRAEAARRDVPIIGTTIAVLLAAGRHGACVWAGDSRIYRFRAGRLQQITRDHSQLEAVRSQHVGTSDDTLVRPPPNVITRAIGGDEALELDSVTLDVLDGDLFLLCSDGLSNEVSEVAIAQALLHGGCKLACQTLLDLALERGAHDNVTAVVVRADDLSSPDRTTPHPVLNPHSL
ncbi:PP2C family protein-serine/threonine phosphatase [Polaromonas hydrogenivorans]|uniref:Protein phosphatase 2C domain-containing protein n=1 Tax=Polaromonas hydrogenivorans TaxID=335476 RepID=A0AAU7LZB1_9BURK